MGWPFPLAGSWGMGVRPPWLAAGAGQAVRAAILVRLWARTPCPVQIRAPSVVSIMVRSHP